MALPERVQDPGLRPITSEQRATYERALRWELEHGVTAHQLPPEDLP